MGEPCPRQRVGSPWASAWGEACRCPSYMQRIFSAKTGFEWERRAPMRTACIHAVTSTAVGGSNRPQSAWTSSNTASRTVRLQVSKVLASCSMEYPWRLARAVKRSTTSGGSLREVFAVTVPPFQEHIRETGGVQTNDRIFFQRVKQFKCSARVMGKSLARCITSNILNTIN